MGEKLIKANVFNIPIIIFTLSCFLFLSTNAQALVYCVGCPSATDTTCTGGGANCASGATFCDSGTNNVVCDDIVEALTCIDDNNDPFATIRIAQGIGHAGPGTGGFIIDNTAGSDQTINILGGFSSTTCGARTLDPSNTIINAPLNDRVFHIDNTTSDSLEVKLEGLTITGGDPEAGSNLCTGFDDGGGVCATSTGGTGGLIFTSNSNIYDGNSAEDGGGLAVIADDPGGGNINATIMDDKFTDNFADFIGGGIFLWADDNMLNATIDNTMIGDLMNDFPFGGNRALEDGGGIGIRGSGGGIDVSNQGNTITHNSTAAAGDGGGGIFIKNISSAQPVTVSLVQDVITSNESADVGGGIYIEAGNDGTNAIVNVLISKTEIGINTAQDFGGGIALTGDGTINLFPVVNNVIFQNTALGQPGGGGVAAVTSGGTADFDLRFVNNTIADNMASGTGPSAIGGGILADNQGNSGTIKWTLPNDLIFGNTADGDGDQVALADTGMNATIALRFSLVPTDQPGEILGATGAPPLAGFVNILENVISDDPQFINAPGGNYRIPNTSPANAAGTNMADPLTVAGPEANPPGDDFDGTARPVPPAIGAFEPVPSPTPTPTASPTPTPTASPTPTPMPTPTPTPMPTPTPTPTPTPPPTPTPIPTPTPPPNIETFPNAKNGKLVTIESEEGTVLSDVKPLAKNLQGCPEGFDGQFLSFPVGSFQYVVSGLIPGDETTVIIDLPPGTIVNSYFKFGPTPDNLQPHCYEFMFDGQTGAQISQTAIVIHHIDGARGDSDLNPNGVIVEPGAPALLSDEPPGTKGDGCSLAQTVSSQATVLNLFIPLLPSFAVGLRSLRRKKRM